MPDDNITPQPPSAVPPGEPAIPKPPPAQPVVPSGTGSVGAPPIAPTIGTPGVDQGLGGPSPALPPTGGINQTAQMSNASAQQPGKKVPVWLWILLGLVVVAVAFVIYYLSVAGKSSNTGAETGTSTETSSPTAASTSETTDVISPNATTGTAATGTSTGGTTSKSTSTTSTTSPTTGR